MANRRAREALALWRGIDARLKNAGLAVANFGEINALFRSRVTELDSAVFAIVARRMTGG
jgi:hypothetical protein